MIKPKTEKSEQVDPQAQLQNIRQKKDDNTYDMTKRLGETPAFCLVYGGVIFPTNNLMDFTIKKYKSKSYSKRH